MNFVNILSWWNVGTHQEEISQRTRKFLVTMCRFISGLGSDWPRFLNTFLGFVAFYFRGIEWRCARDVSRGWSWTMVDVGWDTCAEMMAILEVFRKSLVKFCESQDLDWSSHNKIFAIRIRILILSPACRKTKSRVHPAINKTWRHHALSVDSSWPQARTASTGKGWPCQTVPVYVKKLVVSLFL
jgi:hypothetical protein